MDKQSEAGRVHGVLQIGVLHHQQRTFPAHFQIKLLSTASTLNADKPSNRSGTGEQNRFHARVAVKGFAKRWSVTGNDIENSGRQPSLVEYFSDLESDEGRFF